MAATLVICPAKTCPGHAGFIADGPERTETKTRFPDSLWHADPTDPTSPRVQEQRGDPVVDVIDVFPCPHCGSPVAVSRNAG